METNDGQDKKRIVPTASAVLDDGTIVEMVFRPDLWRTLFAIYSAGRWTLQDIVDLGPDAKLVPFSANNNLIKNEVVLLPSEPRITCGAVAPEALRRQSKPRNRQAWPAQEGAGRERESFRPSSNFRTCNQVAAARADGIFGNDTVIGSMENPYPTPLSLMQETVTDGHSFATAYVDFQSRILMPVGTLAAAA